MDQQDRRREGALARRERRLAYALLLPTFLLVLAVVLLPLLANFWISVKPVTLAELRPPSLVLKEQVRGGFTAAGDEARIEYRYRNSSIKYPLETVTFSDRLPSGVTVTSLDPACKLDTDGAGLVCDLGRLEGKARGKIRIGIMAAEGFAGDKSSFKDSVPVANFSAYNVMTSFDFTLANFERVFSAAEFWDVL